MAKKKKGGPQRKRIKFEVNADIDQNRFLKVYDVQCADDKSAQCPWLIQAMRKGISDRRYTREFIIEEQTNQLVRLDPVLKAIRKSHYQYITELRVWDISLQHSTVADIALIIEKGVYPITKLELMDCDILYYSVERLARSLRVSNLSEVNLDYNEFGDEGCNALCRGCTYNKTIISLSLCYCKLTRKSGEPLGAVAYHSTIREFYLDGNQLESAGVMEMLKDIANAQEDEHYRKIEEEKVKAMMIAEGGLAVTDTAMKTQMGDSAASGGETDGGEKIKKSKKKKKKGKKKKKSDTPPPTPGPYLHKIHLADNGVDSYGFGRNERLFACIAVLCRLLMYSHSLLELDLDDNSIGDLSARELSEALKKRQQGNLPNVKMRISGQMQDDSFAEILKLASGVSKKKGKKKKKK